MHCYRIQIRGGSATLIGRIHVVRDKNKFLRRNVGNKKVGCMDCTHIVYFHPVFSFTDGQLLTDIQEVCIACVGNKIRYRVHIVFNRNQCCAQIYRLTQTTEMIL